MSEASPCVGGGVLKSVPTPIRTDSGSATYGAIVFKIGARHRAADAFQIGGDLAADIAAIEIVEPGMAQMIERCANAVCLQGDAGVRRLAVGEEGLPRSRARPCSSASFSAREPRLAAGDDIAVAGMADRGREQHRRAASCRRSAFAASSASVQPPIAPGTVSAASGPRGGIVSKPCSR